MVTTQERVALDPLSRQTAISPSNVDVESSALY
jgi:hypothetical protein